MDSRVVPVPIDPSFLTRARCRSARPLCICNMHPGDARTAEPPFQLGGTDGTAPISLPRTNPSALDAETSIPGAYSKL